MKLRTTLIPWLILGAGAAGGGLYSLFISSTMDDRGLFPSFHPLLIAVYILAAAVLVLLALSLKKLTSTPAYGKLFPAGIMPSIGCVAGSAGIFVTMLQTCMQPLAALQLFTIILAAISVISLLLIGWFRLKRLRPHYIFHGVLSVFLLLQLVNAYRGWNTQPQLQIYLPKLLALISLMITAYQRAALDGGIGNRRNFSFFNLTSVFFCCLAIASNQWPFFLGMAIWCFTNQCSLNHHEKTVSIVLPDEVLYCIETLTDAGYEAYAVGGCVRDHLLGLVPSDYDLCTSAVPEEICRLFSRHELVRNGEKHGTIGVVLTGKLYEITTFRTEGTYSDTRHPDWVEFVTDIKQDLARRDFTVNAMAYSPKTGIVDPFGGKQDLMSHTLRAVGDPETRFREDALRILRGVRFAVRFALTPEAETLAAMDRCAPLMEQLAWERISTELCKVLPLIDAAQLIRYKKIITQVIPELTDSEDSDQFDRTAQLVQQVSKELPLRLAALLCSAGETNAENVLLRLKVSNALRNRTLQLIRLQTADLSPDKKLLRKIAGEEGQDTICQALSLRKATLAVAGQDASDMDMAELLLQTIRSDGSCLSVKDLAITGSDLLALGTQPGPHIGKCMQSLLSLVQDDILTNTKEELLDAAKAFLEL